MVDLYSHPKYLKDKLCNLPTADAVVGFRNGFKLLIGSYPSPQTLSVLLAQSSLETGNWRVGLHLWNFGNVRLPGNNPDKLNDGEFFTMFRCSEIESGKEVFYYPPDPRSIFRAFKSAAEGVAHHLKFLQISRYQKAWQQCLKGDPVTYCHELRAGSYYTASEVMYTKGVVNLFNSFMKRDDIVNWTDESETPPSPSPQNLNNSNIKTNPDIKNS
jgi:hypothetical protein